MRHSRTAVVALALLGSICTVAALLAVLAAPGIIAGIIMVAVK